MLFAEYRDWTPRFEYGEYKLGFDELDDGDVIKWCWSIYKFVEQRSYDDHDFVHDMYEEICSLDVSPYERNEHLINRKFIETVSKLVDNGIK